MKIRIKRGLNIELAGAPRQQIDDAGVTRSVALLGSDYPGLKPALAIGEGDPVQLGQVLFTDKRFPDVRFTAPAPGRVRAIHRGARRRLDAVVIDVDLDAVDSGQGTFETHARAQLRDLAPERVRAQLLESGLWTALRARPFDGVAPPAETPAAIFVTAMDTNPLAADPAAVLADRAEQFADGVAVLCALAQQLYVCTGAQLTLPALSERAEVVEFVGPHPAGLPGTHIAQLAGVSEQRSVWYVGYQDVIAIGELFVSGLLAMDRVIAVCGPGAKAPRLLRVRSGASLDDLLREETQPGARAVAGSVFANRAPTPVTAWLGRYESQVTVFETAAARECAQRNASGTPAQGNSAVSQRAMLPLEAFERAWPFDAPVLPLLRALLIEDAETARALGCLGLAEEDLAICRYLCPAGQDYALVLRHVLNEIQASAAT